jgi:hypothetical protein
MRWRFAGSVFTHCGLGWGHSKIPTLEIRCLTALRACSALRPTRTTAQSLGRREKRRGNSRIPVCRSSLLAERMCLPSPMYHGTMFHVTVRFRGILASAFNSKKFFTLSSGLLRETKPVSTALGPGASSKYRFRRRYRHPMGRNWECLHVPRPGREASRRTR